MKELALTRAVEAQRIAIRWAKARGASGAVLHAMEGAFALVTAECERLGAGPVCTCGASIAAHGMDGKRVEQFRDGNGMLWGEDELCAGFREADTTRMSDPQFMMQAE